MSDKTLKEILSDPNNLFDSFQMAKKGSSWKRSVQQCEKDILKVIYRLSSSIENETYTQKPYAEFVMRERGKIRPIRSMHISDRIIQRCLCDKILIPSLGRYLIYDNGASLRNKGVDFTRRRLKTHLEKFLRNHKNGYVLLIDFSKFFDNIPHSLFSNFLKKHLKDDSLDFLINQIINSFRFDISYMSKEELENIKYTPFDLMKHRKRLKECKKLRKITYLNRSLGIGSQFSQIGGVFFPTYIDNYFKCRLGVKYYGRYMDDVYIIHEDKSFLIKLKEEFISQAKNLMLFVNPRKTRIESLTNGFIFLKYTYITKNKKILVYGYNKTFVRIRRRLKSLRKFLDLERVDYNYVKTSFLSWKGSILKYNLHKKNNMIYTCNLFLSLFSSYIPQKDIPEFLVA